MKRTTIIQKLVSEGLSEKTLANFSDKQLIKLSQRFLKEQSPTVDNKDVLNTVTLKQGMNPSTKKAIETAATANNAIVKTEPTESETNKPKKKGEKKWIQKAVKKSHEGYCTPMTKPTCTPKRKALAKRFKSGEFNENNVREWVESLVENEYGNVATKNQIMKLIKTKINEQSPSPTIAPPKIKPDTKPGKPKPQEDDDPYVDPFDPTPVTNPEPKFKKQGKDMKGNGKKLSDDIKLKIMSLIDGNFISSSLNENKKLKRA